MDPAETQISQKPTGAKLDLLWNLLTILMLASVGCIGLFFLLIFINPYQALNPLQPPTPVATTAVPIPTATLKQFPPTWTPTVRPTDAPTDVVAQATPEPTLQVVTDEPEPEDDTETGATQSPVENPSGYAFDLVTPIQAISSTFLYASNGCNWAGIGGRITDLEGASITGVVIQLGGIYAGEPVSMTALSGTQLDYGQGGYEFVLGETPVESNQTLWIQLFNQENLPLSEQVFLDTFAECDKNMLLVNFRQTE